MIDPFKTITMNNIQIPLNNKLTIKLAEISQILSEKTINKECEHIGVLTGASGIAMFQFYYAQFSKKESCADLGVELIEHCIEKINAGYDKPTYCDGLTGFGWTLNHLKEKSFVDVDDELLSGLEDYLCSLMLSDINYGNYDFLHGAIGYGIYFLKRYKNTVPKKSKGQYKKYLLKLIGALEASSEKRNGRISWVSEINIQSGKKLKVYNFVLSHGITSIINFLSRLYVLDEFKLEVDSMLKGVVNFILNHANQNLNTLSIFPNYVCDTEKPEYKSRVAWCYGDLGIALSLWHAAHAMEDQNLKDFSLDVFERTAKRRTQQETLVVDACVCHGSFGNAQIFNYIYRQTKNETFKEAAEFWINDGLEKAIHPDGYANYKIWYGYDQKWKNEFSVLEGISGIGLVIMSYLSEDLSDWDECLMIS